MKCSRIPDRTRCPVHVWYWVIMLFGCACECDGEEVSGKAVDGADVDVPILVHHGGLARQVDVDEPASLVGVVATAAPHGGRVELCPVLVLLCELHRLLQRSLAAREVIGQHVRTAPRVLVEVRLLKMLYSKPSIIRQLWSSATNLAGRFAIEHVSQLP